MFKEMFTGINEKSSQGSYSAKFLAAKGYIPISGPMMERLGLSTKNFTAYHATTVSHLKGLSKLGKSKKGVSAFTKGLHSIVSGIVVKPDVVAELIGTKILAANQDFYTAIDNQGRRWFEVKGKKADFMFNALISKPLKEFMKEQFPDSWEEELEYYLDHPKAIKDLMIASHISKKAQNVFLKNYIDNAEKLLNNSMYLKIIQEHLKDASKHKHDELIMNQFKVNKVYSIEAGKYAFDNSMTKYDITKLGYDYGGHVSKTDFSKFPANSELTSF